MGVDRTDYIVYGWKLPYDFKDANGDEIDWYDDKFLPYLEGHEGIKHTLIPDGMCGKYCVFGEIIDFDNDDGWDFQELPLDIQPTWNDENNLSKKFEEVFGVDAKELPKLFIFSHYS
jgi:hypothetical protein